MKEFLWEHIVSMTAMGTVCFTAGCLVCSSKLKDARALAEINARVDREAAAYLDAMDARKPLLPRPSAEEWIVDLRRWAALSLALTRVWWSELGKPRGGWQPGDLARATNRKPDNVLPRPAFFTDLLPYNARHQVRVP